MSLPSIAALCRSFPLSPSSSVQTVNLFPPSPALSLARSLAISNQHSSSSLKKTQMIISEERLRHYNYMAEEIFELQTAIYFTEKTFFWGGSENKRKLAWIKWDKILAAREKGGLEIGSIVSFNLALVLKWRWRFVNSGHLLWVKVIKSLYGENGGFGRRSAPAVGGSPWARIISAHGKLDDKGVVSSSVLYKNVGDGQDTRFWLDCWVGDKPLCLLFPRLAALEVDIGCSVAERWSLGDWRWLWRRVFEGGVSHAHLVEMMGLLQKISCSDRKDVWTWGIELDGEYTVAGTRKWIDDQVLPGGIVKIRWSKLVSRKVNVFVWRARLDRLPTRRLLRDRGIDIPSLMCPICVTEVQAVDVRGIGTLFEWIDSSNLNDKKRKVLEAVVDTTLWMVWRYRNDVVFEGKMIRKSFIFDYVREFSFLWVGRCEDAYQMLGKMLEITGVSFR
ncbi:hypothetical protein LXL04_030092 [Taraxacum kok-saghyz]